MKLSVAVIGAAAAATVASGTLGAVAAEAPTISPTRSVSVGGVGIVAIAQHADGAAADAAYRQAMAAAVADGQSKAQFLAEKTGATLGAVQSVAEGGGSIACTGGSEGDYAEYEGEQPDFSNGPAATPVRVFGAPAAGAAPALPKAKKKKRRRRVTSHARAAGAVSCKLSAEVSLVYAIA